jgi:hypothetical protein
MEPLERTDNHERDLANHTAATGAAALVQRLRELQALALRGPGACDQQSWV